MTMKEVRGMKLVTVMVFDENIDYSRYDDIINDHNEL